MNLGKLLREVARRELLAPVKLERLLEALRRVDIVGRGQGAVVQAERGERRGVVWGCADGGSEGVVSLDVEFGVVPCQVKQSEPASEHHNVWQPMSVRTS